MIIIVIFIGFILGGATGLAFLKLAQRKSDALLIVTALFGALGAASADQLLNWGVTILGLAVLPILAGSIVLPLVAIYAFYTGKSLMRRIRAKEL